MIKENNFLNLLCGPERCEFLAHEKDNYENLT